MDLVRGDEARLGRINRFVMGVVFVIIEFHFNVNAEIGKRFHQISGDRFFEGLKFMGGMNPNDGVPACLFYALMKQNSFGACKAHIVFFGFE